MIGDPNELGAMIHYDSSAYYRLTSNIDLSSTQWSYAVVPAFQGQFDGNGYVIKNLSIHGGKYLGLIGLILGDVKIKDIGIENCNITGYHYLGGLVGGSSSSNSVITNSYSTATVTGGDMAGGLVGFNNNDGSITNSYSTGTVSGGLYLGGLVGYNNNDGSITNSYSTGDVTGVSNIFGGLIGCNDGPVTNSYSTGIVTGASGNMVGGLVGINTSSSITSSYFPDYVGADNSLGTPLDDPNMMIQSNFTDWDFLGESTNGTNDIWRMPYARQIRGYYGIFLDLRCRF